MRLSSNVVFVRETFARSGVSTPLELTTSTSAAALMTAKANRITFWPSIHSLSVKLQIPDTIRLDKIRAVELTINTGRNFIRSAELRIKSATPGLRLITGDSQVTAGDGKCVSKTAKAGVLQLTDLPEKQALTIKIPYMAENDMIDLAVSVLSPFSMV